MSSPSVGFPSRKDTPRMPIETGTYISDLNTANPASNDTMDKADDHIRLLKSTIKTTFPNITGAVTPTHTELNYVTGVTSGLQSQLALKAPLAGPAFSGIPTVPTAAVDTNTLQVASTAYVIAQGYLKSSTAAATYSTPASVTSALGPYLTSAVAASTYAPLVSPAFTGNPTAPTPTAGDNDTSIATTAFVTAAVAGAGGFTTFVNAAGISGLNPYTASGLNLAGYTGLIIYINGMSNTNLSAGQALTVNGVAWGDLTSTVNNMSCLVYVDLLFGICTLFKGIASTGNLTITTGTTVSLTTSTTSIAFALGAGTFDAGAISIYGVK